MSAIMNIAYGVDMMMLRRIFMVVRLAVSVEVMPGNQVCLCLRLLSHDAFFLVDGYHEPNI